MPSKRRRAARASSPSRVAREGEAAQPLRGCCDLYAFAGFGVEPVQAVFARRDAGGFAGLGVGLAFFHAQGQVFTAYLAVQQALCA